MTPTLLITQSDFSAYTELSLNLNEQKKLIQHINNAQELDLKPLLGELFFYDLLSKIKSYRANPVVDPVTPPTETQQAYLDLIEGKVYTREGVEIAFQGLKPVLVYYASAKYLQIADIQATPSGFAIKQNQYSENIDSKRRSAMLQDAESMAYGYWQSVRDYLDAKKTSYPLWKVNCAEGSKSGSKSGARISSISFNSCR